MRMKLACVWEHNGDDTLLYARDYPGAFARGHDLNSAISGIPAEIRSYTSWCGRPCSLTQEIEIVQNVPSQLNIRDADSDVFLDGEDKPLSLEEYNHLKQLALKSAADFLRLYESVPDKNVPLTLPRRTFYGQIPVTAEEMYQHTKNVNGYYFCEIGVDADNEGSIWECRTRGFAKLETMPDFLSSSAVEGSYGEFWSLRKVLRRFLWHDRIHARAMYRHAVKTFGQTTVDNPFAFEL